MKHIVDICPTLEDARVALGVRKPNGWKLVWPSEETFKQGSQAEPSSTLIVKDWVSDDDADGNKIKGGTVDKRFVLLFEKATPAA